VRLYYLVPISSILVFLILTFLPSLLWPPSPSQTPSMLRLVSAVILSAALWSLSYVLRIPVYRLAASISSPCVSISLTTCMSAVLLVLLQELLRLSAFVIVSMPPSHLSHLSLSHPLFQETWFLALGWALAEVATGIAQGFDQLALYQDVLFHSMDDRVYSTSKEPPEMTSPPNLLRSFSQQWRSDNVGSSQSVNEVTDEPGESGMMSASRWTARKVVDVSMDLDEELSRLVNMKARAELEEVYGMPFIEIPVFVSILQRIDSILLSLGLTLLLSFAYARSARPSDHTPADLSQNSFSHSAHTARSGALSLWTAFVAVAALHALLSILHAPPVLPRIGVHTAAYVGLVVGLGTVFAGLGVWGAVS